LGHYPPTKLFERLFGVAWWFEDQILAFKDEGSNRADITRKEMTMKLRVITTIFTLALALVASLVTFSLTPGVASVSASDDQRQRSLHLVKECTSYTGLAGSFCTFTSSNLAAIPVGSKVFYDQAAGTPAGLLDSNVVLDAGGGNRGVGRCTLVFSSLLGLCTFSDGTGTLTGFHARLDVDCTAGIDRCRWDGPYSLTRDRDR